jgi:hypothetical protein
MVSEASMYVDIVSPWFEDFLVGAVLIKKRVKSVVAFLDAGANLFGFSSSFLSFFPDASVETLRLCSMDTFLHSIHHNITQCRNQAGFF